MCHYHGVAESNDRVLTEPKPLAQARARLPGGGGYPRLPKTPLTPEQRAAAGKRLAQGRREAAAQRGDVTGLLPSERQHRLVELRAAGMPVNACAKALNVGASTIARDLRVPEVQADLAMLRQKIRAAIMEHAAGGLVDKAFAMANEKATAGEAKDFDATMRGIHAIEKVTQSASGEAQRVHVEGTGSAPVTHVDLKVLINQVLGETS